MSPVLTIAIASVKENSRRKLLLVFSLISLLVTAVLIFVALRKEDAGVIFGTGFDIGSVAALGFLAILALIAAMAVSMNSIGPSFASGEAALVLARPLSRTQYALGRLLGSAIAVLGFTALVATETQIARIATGEAMSGLLWEHWLVQGFNLLVISAFTTLMSCFFSVSIVSAVLAFVFDQVVTGLFTLHSVVQASLLEGPLATIIEVGWYVTPKFVPSPLQTEQLRSAPAEAVPFAIIDPTLGLWLWAAAWWVAIMGAVVLITNRKQI